MEFFVVYILLAFAVGTLLFWLIALRPFMAQMKDMTPLLVQLCDEFKDSPGAFKRLKVIEQQFSTDHGSTLRDVVNRLEENAIQNTQASESLKVGVEASRLLAKEDREQILNVVVLLDRVTLRLDRLVLKVEHSAVVSERIEATVDRSEEAGAIVATNLTASYARADEIARSEPHGAAADAASRRTPAEQVQEQEREQAQEKAREKE